MSEPDTVIDWLREHRPPPSGYQPWTLARLGAAVAAGDDLWFLLGEFLDDVRIAFEPADREALIDERPADLTDRRQHAFLGALAEHLAAVHNLRRPHWAIEPDRFLDRYWFASDRDWAVSLAIVQSPAAFRRRGIFITAGLLERR